MKMQITRDEETRTLTYTIKVTDDDLYKIRPSAMKLASSIGNGESSVSDKLSALVVMVRDLEQQHEMEKQKMADETRIDDMLEKLSSIRKDHGNLRCVTPGFAECGIDDVDRVHVVTIKLHCREHGHCGRHDYPEDVYEAKRSKLKTAKAVLINF